VIVNSDGHYADAIERLGGPRGIFGTNFADGLGVIGLEDRIIDLAAQAVNAVTGLDVPRTMLQGDMDARTREGFDVAVVAAGLAVGSVIDTRPAAIVADQVTGILGDRLGDPDITRVTLATAVSTLREAGVQLTFSNKGIATS